MTHHVLPSFGEWSAARNAAQTGDPLWAVQAYRLASYAIACHTFDRQTHRPLCKADTLAQLTQAVGSIAANIAEGYSRPSLADQSRFYGYALGSVREAVAWYDTLRIELGAVADDRQATLIQIRRLLLTTLRNARTVDARAGMSNRARPTRADDP